MASYKDWNQALVSYFTSGVPRDTKVYLSVDDNVLERIGQNFNQELITANWSEDFRAAVREEVIVDEQVNLSNLLWRDSKGVPQSVAFLGATVLAAYQMADEEKISELNYFKRLREILGLSGSGRLPGMKSGQASEEPLWKDWNLWLMQHGFLPSAQRGRGGTTYINYPISQSILRCADKDRLCSLFHEQKWTAQWDAQTLFAQIRLQAQGLSKHLKELLTGNRRRYEAVAEAIHEVYEEWQNDEKPTSIKLGASKFARHIFAGLYRTEDPFLGQVDYYLYPKQLRGHQLESVRFQYKNNVYELRNERPGWYFPLDCPLDISKLERGARYQITSPTDLNLLILPARDFWILIPDPDNPDAGAYASWGHPSLGSQFILLCKKELLPDVERLQNECLLKWHGEPQPVFDNSNWVEFHQCMVVSQAWDGVFINNQELKDALQPNVRLSISFSGGLRVPQISAWLKGHSPQVTVFGFSPKVQLQINKLVDNCQILDELVNTNTPISVDFPSPGDYLVEAICGGELSQRFVKIVDWGWLHIENYLRCEELPIGFGHYICGSVIKPVSLTSAGV